MSQCRLNIWLLNSIQGGWVLIFDRLNNRFARRVFHYTRVRWLVFEVVFLPAVVYCTYDLDKLVVYSVKWRWYLSLYIYAVSLVYMFVLLHAVKSKTRIEYIKCEQVSCIGLYHGSSIVTESNKWHHLLGGVSRTWGLRFPRDIPWRYEPLMKWDKKRVVFSECIGQETSALLCKQF